MSGVGHDVLSKGRELPPEILDLAINTPIRPAVFDEASPIPALRLQSGTRETTRLPARQLPVASVHISFRQRGHGW